MSGRGRRSNKRPKYVRKTPAEKECLIYPIFKFEIVCSGNKDTLNGRVHYNHEANSKNKSGTSYKRGKRRPIREALAEWKSAYRHRVKSLKPLNLNDIIRHNSHKFTKPMHTSKLSSMDINKCDTNNTINSK